MGDGQLLSVRPSRVKAFEDIGRKALRELADGLGSRGHDGPGTGGGKGDGNGPGTGSGTRPGNGIMSPRMQRVLRWTMKFNTFDGDDYRKQLAGLGAILALDDGHGGYLVIRDLTNVPVKAEPGDLRSLHRIFWIDSNQDSVASLARALGVRPPREFIALFPETVEKELLRKELAFRGLQERDIKETTFEVRQRGGRYTPVVVGQKAK
jgi:hypothetical protein